MISREVLLEKLQLCVDDPMWPDHVEMPKQLIRIVIEQLTRQAQGAPTWPSDGDMLDLLIASGYDAEQVHPTCYRGFGWKTFTEKLKAAVTSTVDQRAGRFK